MIRIPQPLQGNKRTPLQQNNDSDVIGHLWASCNIDLTENDGILRIGKRLVLNTDSVDDVSLGIPVAFKAWGGSTSGKIFTVAGSKVFSSSALYPSSSFTAEGGGAPTNCNSLISDAELFRGGLYVTTDSTAVYYYDGSWHNFTATGSGSGTGTVKMLTSYGDRMYMTYSLSKISSWSTANGSDFVTSGQYTLSFSDSNSNVISWIRSSSNRIWIGTINTNGGKGYIYEWDGSSSEVTKSYRLEAAGALACVIKNDIPYVMDTNGYLLAWNGGTFKGVAGLNQKSRKLLNNPLSFVNNRFVHPNGMSLVDGAINVVIDGRLYDNTTLLSLDETIPSGVWEYDETYGFYHKHSFGLSKSGDTITDYGQIRIAGAGAIAELNEPSTSSSRNGKFLAGAKFYTNSSSTKFGIFYDDINDTLQKAGNFTTIKIQAMGVTDVWQKVFLTYRQFLASTDRMVLKYRLIDEFPIEAPITWTSTTTFTTTTNVSSYWTSGTGGEVEIVQGVGSGMSSHITSIVNNAGTYTVTVDEVHSGASNQTAQARFQKWIKMGEINDQTSQYKEFGNGKNGVWIQFKIWMLFTGKNEFNSLIIENIPHVKV